MSKETDESSQSIEADECIDQEETNASPLSTHISMDSSTPHCAPARMPSKPMLRKKLSNRVRTFRLDSVHLHSYLVIEHNVYEFSSSNFCRMDPLSGRRVKPQH